MPEDSQVSSQESVPTVQPVSEVVPVLQSVSPRQSDHGTPSILSRLPRVENRLGIALILIVAFPFGLYYLVRQPKMSKGEKAIWFVAWLAAWPTLTLLIGESVFGIGILSMIVCILACIVLVWTHPDPRWTSKKKGVLSGATGVAVGVAYMGFLGVVVFPITLFQFRQATAEADRQWNAGQRQEAMTFYTHALTKRYSFIDKTDQPTFFQRVIDFEAESGNTASATTFIELAHKKGISLSLHEPKAQELLAQLRKKQEDAVAAERAKKDAADREKREAAERAEKERQDRIAVARKREQEAAEKARQDKIAADELAEKKRLEAVRLAGEEKKAAEIARQAEKDRLEAVRIENEKKKAAELAEREKQELPDVLRRLKDSNPSVRTIAAVRLGSMKSVPKEALSPLLDAMKDDNNSVKFFAIQAIGNIGPDAKDAVPALTEALTTDEKGQVGMAALMSLEKIGKPAIPAIIKGLMHTNKGIRLVAAGTLGKFGKDAAEAVPLLVNGLKTERDDKVRLYFASGLSLIDPDNKEYLPVLIASLDVGRDAEVQTIAAFALGRIGARASAAVPALERIAKSSDPNLAEHAAAALLKIRNAK